MLVDRVADGSLPSSRQEQFEHHVVGQQNLWRVIAHPDARLFILLPGVLTEADRESAPRSLLVVVLVASELHELGVDERVHRIDHDPRYPWRPWAG